MHFSLHHDFTKLDPISTAWNELLAHSIYDFPFLRYEYLTTWWATRGGGEWPASTYLAIVTAHRDGHLVGIAPLFQGFNNETEPALLLLGSIEVSDYLDLIVQCSDQAEFLSGLMDFLEGTPLAWKTLDWHNLMENSPSLPYLEIEARKRGWNWSLSRTYHAPSIPLAGDFAAYLSKIDKKQRHEIRRKMRRAEERGGISWYSVVDEKSLDAEVEAFMTLMTSDPEKAVFLTPEMRRHMHAISQAAFRAGWLQLTFLTVDGEKAAGYMNFDYQNRIWVYNSGIDRRFMEFSPGWVLLGCLLQWANENKRSEFDFMRGHEDYKYQFGGVDKYLVNVKITR